MRHGDHGARVVLQRALEPGDGLGVEVIRRLIEEQEVGLGQQETAQRDPATLAARECGDLGVSGREAECVHGDLEGPVEIPHAGSIDLRLQVGLFGQQGVDVGVGRAEGGAHLVVAVDQALGLADALGHVAGHVLGRIELRLLREVPDGEARGEARLSGVAVVLARHDPQQRGLARPVGADDADLGAGIEGEVDALQHLAVGRVEALEAAHGVAELGSHGCPVCPISEGGLVRASNAWCLVGVPLMSHRESR